MTVGIADNGKRTLYYTHKCFPEDFSQVHNYKQKKKTLLKSFPNRESVSLV